MTATFSTTALANGKMELIPEHMVILNPEAEYAAQCLYFVWAFKADEPATLDDAICEKKGAFLYGYFTNYADLYKLGRHDEALERTRFESLSIDYLDMNNRVLNALSNRINDGETWTYAFCLCDTMGSEVPVGTGYGFKKGPSHG